MKNYYSDFFDTAHREFIIPGIYEGFVPQGFFYLPEHNAFLVSGYDYDTGYSKIYTVTNNGAEAAASSTGICDESGNPLECHSGGVGAYGDVVYLAGNNGLCYILSLADILSGTGTANIAGSFATYNNADYCTVHDGRLYIGEFYYGIKFNTDESHHITTPAGGENPAVISVFKLDNNAATSLDESPESMISIRGKIQGICFDAQGSMILSESVFFSPSRLYYYNIERMKQQVESFAVNDNDIPLCFADDSALLMTKELPPKVEGLAFCDGRVYFVNEAASSRFLLGRFLGLEYSYSIDE